MGSSDSLWWWEQMVVVISEACTPQGESTDNAQSPETERDKPKMLFRDKDGTYQKNELKTLKWLSPGEKKRTAISQK